MFSSVKRFSGLCAVAVITYLSAASGAVASSVISIAGAAMALFGLAADAFTRAVLTIARRMPASLTGPTVKRPSGTAVERQRLVPSTAYALKQDMRRRPIVQDAWRMCAST